MMVLKRMKIYNFLWGTFKCFYYLSGILFFGLKEINLPIEMYDFISEMKTNIIND